MGFIKNKLLKDFVIQREELKQENSITEEPKNKKDITKSDIKKYKNRKKIIQQVIKDAVNKKYASIKIVYSKDKEKEEFKKFKLEATAMLKESGITAVF